MPEGFKQAVVCGGSTNEATRNDDGRASLADRRCRRVKEDSAKKGREAPRTLDRGNHGTNSGRWSSLAALLEIDELIALT